MIARFQGPPGRDDLQAFLRRLAWLVIGIHALLLAGAIGFVLTTDVNLWDGFVWSLDTVATLGSIPHDRDPWAELVKVTLVMTGVGTLFYALVTVTEFFVAGHVGELLAERRMLRMVDALTDHYIICGFGRVGRQVARDLRAAGADYVIVDGNTENRALAPAGIGFIEGDGGEDEILRAAGIDRARSVIACVDSDAANIFIALTARELRPDIEIVARASADDSEKKLRRAGADRVISPYKASGSEMARYALHPHVRGALPMDPDYRMEEIEVSAGSAGVARSIGDIAGGAIVFGLRHANGIFDFMPPAHQALCAGDILMAMGNAETMDRLERLFDASPQKATSA